MNLDNIVARIKAEVPASILKSVGGSADLDAAMSSPPPPPAAFVIPLGEKASPSELTMVIKQRETHRFGVVTVIVNRRDAAGKAATGDLAPVRAALKQALIGWVQNPVDGEPVQFLQGDVLRLDGDGRLWWMDQFFFEQTYRS